MRRYQRYEYDRGYDDGRHDSVGSRSRGGTFLAHLTYGLYVCGIFTGALTTVAGLLLAYVARDRRDPVSDSHFSFLIDTFWSALIAFILVGGLIILLAISIIGIPIAVILWLGFWIWYIMRLARGWAALTGGEYAPRT